MGRKRICHEPVSLYGVRLSAYGEMSRRLKQGAYRYDCLYIDAKRIVWKFNLASVSDTQNAMRSKTISKT